MDDDDNRVPNNFVQDFCDCINEAARYVAQYYLIWLVSCTFLTSKDNSDQLSIPSFVALLSSGVRGFKRHRSYIIIIIIIIITVGGPKLDWASASCIVDLDCQKRSRSDLCSKFYVFGGRIRRFAKVNVNKVNIFYCIVLIMVASCLFRCTL